MLRTIVPGRFRAQAHGQAARMSELMEEPEGFENESEDEELMAPQEETNDDDDEESSAA